MLFAFLTLADVRTFDTASGMTWVEYMAAFMAVVGHVFPVYYGFKGGKGVLAAISGIFVLDWRTGCVLLGVFIILVALTRYVSLGSVVSSALFFAVTALFGALLDNDPSVIANAIIGAFTGGLIVFMHRGNIQRLLTHTEKKLGEKSK